MTKTHRLIAFGCSYTYGQGLPDCESSKLAGFTFDRSTPSKLGWPQQTADALGLKLINKSIPGASNLEILYNILSFPFEETDTVVIMWSHTLRDMIVSRMFNIFPSSRKQLGLWKKSRIAMKWAAQLSEEDYAMRTWIYMHHAGLHLESINVKYIHYPVTMQELNKFKVPNLKIDNLYKTGLVQLDQCENDSHPGIKSNSATANVIIEILKQL